MSFGNYGSKGMSISSSILTTIASISPAGWAYLKAMNQSVAKTSSPTFAALTVSSVTPSATQWGYFSGLNQALTTSSNAQFSKIGISQAPGTEVLEVTGNIKATGTLACAAAGLTVGTRTLSDLQLSYLAALDQALSKASSVEFTQATLGKLLFTNPSSLNNTVVTNPYPALVGANNSLYGVYCAPSIGAGYQNCCYGTYAGNALTSGYSNVFMGYQAGFILATGYDNTCVGAGAGINLPSNATYNTCIGKSAGPAATSYGTFVGNLAGFAVSGANNTCVGSSSGQTLTTGTNNVFVGNNTSVGLGTASQAVIVGYGASSTSGDSVIVGHNASGLYNCVSIGSGTTANGNYSTAIGLGSSTNGQYGAIAIGHGVVSAGSLEFAFGETGGTQITYVTAGTTAWATRSDERLKKDITDLDVGLNLLTQIKPIKFKWKEAAFANLPTDQNSTPSTVTRPRHEHLDKTNHGFSYQRIKAACEALGVENHELCREREGYGNVAPTALIPYLVNAVCELDARLKTIEKGKGA